MKAPLQPDGLVLNSCRRNGTGTVVFASSASDLNHLTILQLLVSFFNCFQELLAVEAS